MKKLLTLTTISAIAINAISPAFATQLPPWSEVIEKAGTEGGGWVRGHHSNTVFKPLAGRDGFLFGNVLADDIPLPRVTDITKVLQAAKKDAKPIIVASNDWILPSNPMLCEIAEQVKMTCGDFTEAFYRYSQKDDDGNWSGLEESTAELEKVQAQVIEYVEAMGVSLIDVTESGTNPEVEALKATIALLETDAEANAATIAQLNDMISGLKLTITAKDLDITKLNEALSAAEAATKAANDLLADEKAQHAITQAAANEYKAKLQAEIDAHAETRAGLKAAQADLAAAGVEIEELNDLIAANQKHINVLVGQKNEYYDALIQIGNNIGIAANSKNEVIDAVSALHIKYTSTAHDLANEKIAHGLTQDLLDQAETNFAEAVKSIEAATTEITSLKSDLNTANNMIDALKANLDNRLAELAAANVEVANYEVAVETFETNFSDYYEGEVTSENFANKITEAFKNYGEAVEADVAAPLNAKIEMWKTDFKNAVASYESVSADLAEKNAQWLAALDEITEKDAEIKALEIEVDQLGHEIAGLESQLDAEKSKVDYWMESHDAMEDKWNDALDQIDIKDDQIEVLEGVAASRLDKIEELQDEVDVLETSEASLQAEVASLENDIAAKNDILTTMYNGLNGYYSAENEDNINFTVAAEHVEKLKNDWFNAKTELALAESAIDSMWETLGFDDDYAWEEINWAKYVQDQFASLETQLATQKAKYKELNSTYTSLANAVTEAENSANALNFEFMGETFSNYHYSFTDPANNIDGVVEFDFENNTPTASKVKLAANQLGGNNAGMHKLISLKVDGENVWTDADLSTFSIHVKSSSVEELEKAVQAIADQAYDNGYKDGYGDGYADGWTDAVDFIQENK